MLKKLLAILLAAANLSVCVVFAGEYSPEDFPPREKEIEISVNGEALTFSSPPVFIDGSTYAQTDVLAEKLGLDPGELESVDHEGVRMSSVRACADKKGWTTYWQDWYLSYGVHVIDTQSLRNEFKEAVSKYITLIEKANGLPENGEYSISFDGKVKADGGKNGFQVYTTAQASIGIRLNKDKIAGKITVKYDGLARLVMMLTSQQMPYADFTMDFYLDDSGIYVKSPFISNMELSEYRVTEEFRALNLHKWLRYDYPDSDGEKLGAIFERSKPENAVDALVNTIIFGAEKPEDAFASDWTYGQWKETVQSVVDFEPNKYIELGENTVTIKITATDLQWYLEKRKDDIESNAYYDEQEKEKNLTLLEAFIDGIRGTAQISYFFEAGTFTGSETSAGFDMAIPFYFDQKISDVSLSLTGKTELSGIGGTVITDAAPRDYITQKQIEESNVYQYNQTQEHVSEL